MSEVLAPLRRRLEALRRQRGPALSNFPLRVRELVVVASSSRGGSSMLAETLRASTSLVHLRAELNPFLRLVGLTFPESGSGSGQTSRVRSWSSFREDPLASHSVQGRARNSMNAGFVLRATLE